MTEWIDQQPSCTHVASIVRSQVAGTGGGVVQDDDGVRLAQPKQLRGEQAYHLGFAAPRCVLVPEAQAMIAIVGPRLPSQALAAGDLRITLPAPLETLGDHAHTQCETCATKATVPDLLYHA